MEIRKICVLVISTMLLATFTPLVLAATEDSVIITFDPDGDIDIDVSLPSHNFTAVLANTWSNTTGSTFILYNNGTVAMDTQIKTNATTDEGDMSLNASGVAPVQDQYAIYIEGLNTSNYITTAYDQELGDNMFPSGSDGFDICLLIGTNLSANHSWQTTTIYFQGTQS